MTGPSIQLIAAVARNGAIGKDNRLLVHLPGDLPRFKQLTLGWPVVMGRKTWDSIGRPLPGRRNLVLTRNRDWRSGGVEAAGSLEAALERLATVEKLFVIGGAEVYAQALPRADVLHLTEIDAEFAADTYFPAWDRADFRQTSRQLHASPQGLRYSFVTYHRI